MGEKVQKGTERCAMRWSRLEALGVAPAGFVTKWRGRLV